MAISIYVLEKSVADFAGSVVAVSPDGSAISFDAPHLHATHDKEASSRAQREKRVFLLGAQKGESGGKDFDQTLRDIKGLLRKIAVPMVSAKPMVNSDGISVRRYIVYQTSKVDLLIPKVLSGLEVSRPDGVRCEAQTHFAMMRLAYLFCPIDGTPMAAVSPAGIYETFFREKFRISEVRVEESAARKRCPEHADERFPNLYSHCPRCGGKLGLARKPS